MKINKIKLYIVVIVFGISLAIIYTGHISAAHSANEVKSAVGQDVEAAKKAQIVNTYGNLPLSFIQNDGQVDKKVKFYEKGSGRVTFFTKDGIYLSLTNGQSSSKSPSSQSELLKLIPIGANKHPKIVTEGMQKGKVNYFVGNDPKKWKTNIPTHQAVVYQEIYPGIDLKFYGNNRQMEYDIIVKPGADPAIVKFAYEGIKGLRVTDEGNLEISLKEGTILQKKPIVYQEIEGKQVKLDGKFKILEQKDAIGHGEGNARVVTFAYAIEVAQYDKNHPLIIDPVLVYSTYLGGISLDYGMGIAVDASGNAYVTGYTSSTNFPTANAIPGYDGNQGAYDAFVTKLKPDDLNTNNTCTIAYVTRNDCADLIYSTYLGGSNFDYGMGIAVDASGNAYVTGYTSSSDFPRTAGAFQATFGGTFDVFVTKLNSAGGTLLYSTYLGGSNFDYGMGIAVDASGNAYVTGFTSSLDFPTTPGAFQTVYGGGFDAFVTKLNPTQSGSDSLVYSTYLGGSGYDVSAGIAVDALGQAYVTGFTTGYFPRTFLGFIQTPAPGYGGGDAFVTRLDAAGGALGYSDLLGGNSTDVGLGIAVDADGNAYVTGYTASIDFPTTTGAFQENLTGGVDAFVTKIFIPGHGPSNVVFSTYLGGTDFEYGVGIAVDTSRTVYVTGYTQSSNFPLRDPLPLSGPGGVGDAFVTRLSFNGKSILYSTYLGGGSRDVAGGIALDTKGNAYVTGSTTSFNYPTTHGAYDNLWEKVNDGGVEAFVTKIGFIDCNIPPHCEKRGKTK